MLFADLCPHFKEPHSYLSYQVPLYDLNAMDSHFLGCPFSLRDIGLFGIAWVCLSEMDPCLSTVIKTPFSHMLGTFLLFAPSYASVYLCICLQIEFTTPHVWCMYEGHLESS